MSKVGIFAGSFDPVHAGHISFALQAIDKMNLDEVYFLPEVKPRFKPQVSHISHRETMLKLALKPYKNLKVLSLPDKQFDVKTTLPKLTKKFQGKRLFYLLGSDEANRIPEWPGSGVLLKRMDLVVAKRAGTKFNAKDLPDAKITLLRPKEPKLSSKQIREAASKGKTIKGSLKSIDDYIKKNWIYSEVPNNS